MNLRSDSKKTIDNDPTPVYYRIQQKLKEFIKSGRWMPGEAIPSSRRLTQTFEVSMGTIQKAIANLRNEGYLEVIQGKGTFVAGGASVVREKRLFYLRLQHFHAPESELWIHFHGIERLSEHSAASRALVLDEPTPFYAIERTFYERDSSVLLTVSYLPCKDFPDFDKLKTFRFEQTPLYVILKEEYSVPTVQRDELFGVTEADYNLSGILQVPQGHPLLEIEAILYTYGGKPFEYRKSYCVADCQKIFRRS